MSKPSWNHPTGRGGMARAGVRTMSKRENRRMRSASIPRSTAKASASSTALRDRARSRNERASPVSRCSAPFSGSWPMAVVHSRENASGYAGS